MVASYHWLLLISIGTEDTTDLYQATDIALMIAMSELSLKNKLYRLKYYTLLT